MKRRQRLPEIFSSAEWLELGGRLRLTPRQLDVARMICRGKANAEMGRKLHLARNTVRMHVRALYRRLGINDRVGVPVKLIFELRKALRQKK